MRDTKEGIMNRDTIEIFEGSLIQHGKLNNRIYLLKTGNSDVEKLISGLDQLAREKGYTKIFGKIRPALLPCFISYGFKAEAFIPGFFKGKDDCIIASKFYDKNRAVADKADLKRFLELFENGKNVNRNSVSINNGFECMTLNQEDAGAISKVMKQVFASYPFPVDDPAYIRQTMENNHSIYFGIKENNQLMAVSTAETDMEEKNAEMTDFAVLPQYRGKKLAGRLLSVMEEALRPAGLKTLYTIARLKEPGMNKTFINAGYRYSGTLVNNTNISGSIESMNIFYKQI
jgi:lysine 2,3-aminomutase